MIEIHDANAVFRMSLNRFENGRFEPRKFYLQTHPAQIFVWDGDNHNDRRRKLFPGYKIRDYTGQEDIFTGLSLYRELLLYSKAVQVEVPEWEADDVCATLARHFAAQGQQVKVFTNDFDFHQLSTKAGIIVHGVKPSEDVAPHLTSAYKALRGDPSDRIPGIEGFGHKSWVALAPFHEEINHALANRNVELLRSLPFKPKVRLWLSLDENVESIFTYYAITQFQDVPIDLIEKHSHPGLDNPAAAEALFQRFLL